MEMFSPLLALCKGNPPVTGGFPLQKASNTDFDFVFDVSLNKLLNKQSHCRWLRHYDAHIVIIFLNELLHGALGLKTVVLCSFINDKASVYNMTME